MDIDLYEGFAERYDLTPTRFYEPDPHEIQFFRRIFSKNDVNTILDCACGTGRHLSLFCSLGYEVWGTDKSQAMLDQARKNLTRCGVEIPLQQADYRNLPRHFQRNFDAITCLGSIGYMPDEKQFLRAFRSMHTILRPGGILVLTTIPTDRQWVAKPRFKLVVNTADVSRLFVMDYTQQTVLYHILDIFHSQERAELKVWSAELTVLLSDQQEQLLKEVGFHDVQFYGDFVFNPYDKENSEHLITAAIK
jgi:glycine/sarcosine N-methyltransferase